MKIDKARLEVILNDMARGVEFAQTGPCTEPQARMAMGVGKLAQMAMEYMRIIPEDTGTEPEPEQKPGIPWNDVKFLDVPDVRSWRQVSGLNVTLTGEFLKFNFKAPHWPDKECFGQMLYANPWVIARIGDEWLGATFEWIRRGGESKSKAAVASDHIKRKEFQDWKPTSGERLGFMVTSLARAGARTVNERTEVTEVTWYA